MVTPRIYLDYQIFPYTEYCFEAIDITGSEKYTWSEYSDIYGRLRHLISMDNIQLLITGIIIFKFMVWLHPLILLQIMVTPLSVSSKWGHWHFPFIYSSGYISTAENPTYNYGLRSNFMT